MYLRENCASLKTSCPCGRPLTAIFRFCYSYHCLKSHSWLHWLKPKFWPTKHFLNKPDKKQRQSHWGLWPRLHEPLEVNCLMISCTWGTNASFSNNRRTKASVNAMKLGTWRAACTQMTLTGNLGYEGYKTTKGTTSPPSVRILDYSCEYFWRGYDPPLNDSLILLHPMDFTASFLQRRNRWVRIVCKRKLPSRSNSEAQNGRAFVNWILTHRQLFLLPHLEKDVLLDRILVMLL